MNHNDHVVNRAAWLLGPVLALALLPSNVVATALPLLRDEWNASATELGIVFAAYQVGYVAAVLLVLPLTDRVPAGRVIAACSLGVTVAFLLWPVLQYLMARGMIAPRERFGRLVPRETYEAALETRVWLGERWADRRKTLARR